MLPHSVTLLMQDSSSSLMKALKVKCVCVTLLAGDPSVLISVLLFIMSDSAFPSTSQAHATMHHSISAASAGSIATLITHPFDVIKASC